MHPDLEKLLEAGKIKEPIAERLNQVSPGQFVLHKAWGAGKVLGWDLPAKKVTIDFEEGSERVMDLQFAVQRTEALDADDFRAKKVEGMETLRGLAEEDPVALVVQLLESHGGSMTVDALERELSGGVVPEKTFRKWWDGAKRALRESKRVIVPSRRTEALTLRDDDLTPAQALVSDFEEARDLKTMAKALEAIAADLDLFKSEPDLVAKLMSDIDEAARKSAKIQLALSLQLLSLRDELIAGIDNLELSDESLRLPNLLLAEESQLATEMGSLPTARQRAIYRVFPEAFGKRWVEAITALIDSVGSRGIAEIAKLLDEHKHLSALHEWLQLALARRALETDSLLWIVRERKGMAQPVFCHEVGSAILNLLESDFIADGPRTTARLQTALSEDKELIADLVSGMDATEMRNFSRLLLDNPVFADLDKKSLMARVIKARPEAGELVSGDSNRRDEALVVSWDSLKRKEAELDDLLRNRIPQNTKDIAIARSYGDLRENFEYKSSKDMQKVLMRRKTELQREIDLARGTDFQGAGTGEVNIGTRVTLEGPNGEKAVYTVLGAWDSDPEKQIVSYLSETGASMLGKKPGETADIRNHETDQIEPWTVREIVAFDS